MAQQPPVESPRDPDPTDAGWVDHILDQLTNRPMPAGPDVEPGHPAEPDVPEPALEPPPSAQEPAEPQPARRPRPRPRDEPVLADAAAPPGLLDELLSMDDQLLSMDTELAGETPVIVPPAAPAPAVSAAPAPPSEPREPQRPPPAAPPGVASGAPAPQAVQPPPVTRPAPPKPPPSTQVPPPPRRRTPRPGPTPAGRRGDPMLASAPPRGPEPAPPLRRRPRAAVPESAGNLHDEDLYDGFEEDFGEDLAESRSPWRTVAGWVVTVALAIVLSLVIRSFVAHAFHVESGSMEPTLTPGDRILVNKLSDNPSRGDLVVFGRSDGDLVKRVVALEGETVYFKEGGVKIGDMWLIEPYLSAATGTYVRSAIPNCDPTEGFDGVGACTVPERHVFVLGDNRGVSFDSRNFGPVPRDDLVGSAVFQFWPLGDLRGL